MVDNIFSIDFEDWFHAYGNKNQIIEVSRTDPSTYQNSIVEEGCEKLLDILDKFNTKSTFFILGSIAKYNKKIIKKIYDRGHEIGSHGNNHLPLYFMSLKEFEYDILESKKIIEDVIQDNIISYRAPGFSLSNNLNSIYEILLKNNFKISSSVLIGRSDYGGAKVKFNKVKMFTINDKTIFEFPSTTYNFFGFKFNPVGGGYMRVLNHRVIFYFLNNMLKNDIPINLYIHPRELVLGHPKLKNLNINRYLKSYLNMKTVDFKLNKILSKFKFDRLDNVIKSL